MGFRYWAIAISGLVSGILAAALPFSLRPVSTAKPAFRSISDSILFSWRILVSRLSWYLYSNADFVVAGRMLGTSALGTYTLAWNFANLPGEKIVSLVTSVTPTFFATVSNDKAAMRQHLAILTEVLAVIMFPIVSGFALLAPQFVSIAFGPKWQGAVLPLQILAMYTFLRSVTSLLPQVINAVGATRFGAWHSLSTLAVLPVSFWFASRWGVIGIAGVWVVVYPLITIPLFWRTLKSIEMPTGQYFAALQPSIMSTGVMIILVLLVQRLLPPTLPNAVKLIEGVVIGVLAYSASLLLLFRGHVMRYVAFVRELKQRR
jgi:PST family polysaccharide transporter